MARQRAVALLWANADFFLNLFLFHAGVFALATEDRSDFGLPHTLEHLVFLGSKTYPHKGKLEFICFIDFFFQFL